MYLDKKISVAVVGAAGRMGKEIVAKVLGIENFELRYAVVRNALDMPASDIPYVEKWDPDDVDILIDFTSPSYSLENIRIASKYGCKVVCGTTGFKQAEMKEIQAHATNIPIVYETNMSIGINIVSIMMEKLAALCVPRGYADVHISEAHHRHKKDKPSGTALTLAKNISENSGIDMGQINFSSIRGGGIVGEHSAHFISELDEIVLSHRAFDRSIFAEGAVNAAIWLSREEKAGLYSMRDVLQIECLR